MKISKKLTINLNKKDLEKIIKNYLEKEGYCPEEIDFIVKKKEKTYNMMHHKTFYEFEGAKCKIQNER